MPKLRICFQTFSFILYTLPGKGELEYTQLRAAMRESFPFHEIQTVDGFATVRPKEILGVLLIQEEKE